MDFDSALFNWLVLPFLIYFARIVDVSLGTMRIISLSKGLKNIAPLLGFVEILIWLMAIRQIFNHLDNPLCYIAYAGGFATGIYTGMLIENKLALGLRVVRIITRKDSSELIQSLRSKGYGATVTDAEGNTGMVKVIFTIIKRSDIKEVIREIKHFNPKAFYSIEDIRAASEGIFPNHSTILSRFMQFEKKAK